MCEKVCKSVAKCVKSLYILRMFGFNTPSIDSKGRIAIPARYRIDFKTQNHNEIVITKDPQYPSLKLYHHSEWQRISTKLQSLQGLDPIVRNLQWTILGNAYQTDIDIEGRMLVRIPSDLQSYAEINEQKQVALVGMGNKFEIWNIENWEMRQTGGSLSTEILDVVLPESIKVCKSVAKCVKSLYILRMFGFNTPSIDSKGRIAIPARYRIDFKTQNHNEIVITKDPQYPSLKLYHHSEWQRISTKLQSLQGLDPIVRNLQWTILGNAYQTDIDIEGRMLVRIPSDLQSYAEINEQKQVALVGMGNKFEIWNIENWEMRQTGGSLSTEILDVVLPESIKEMSF